MKKLLLEKAKKILDTRMQEAWDATQATQNAINTETKSSAGDKYETSRAMGQQERDRHAQSYEKTRLERIILEKIDIDKKNKVVALGALVETSLGNFFLSVSLGKIILEEQEDLPTFWLISTQSPLGMLFLGKEIGEICIFQNKEYIIKNIL